MSIGQSIRVSTKWLISGKLGAQLLNFAFGVALARLLVPEDFGLMVTIQVFTGFVGMISTGGLGQALVREKNADETDFQVVFSIQLVVGIIVYLMFFIIAPWFSGWFDNQLYTELIRVSALSFILRPFIQIHHSWLHREMRFRERTIIGFTSTIVTGLTSVIMAVTGFGVWSLIFGGFAGSIITIILVSRVSRITIALRFDWARLRRISGYGVKVVGNDLVDYIRQKMSNLIISRIAGAGMVGLFNKADSLGGMPAIVIGGSVYQPVFREMAKTQDNHDLNRYLFFKMITLLVVYTMPICIGLSWLAEPFINVVYGDKWMPAAEPLQLLAAGGILTCIMHPCGAVLAAHNRLGYELIVHLTATIFTGIACYIGLGWGLVGAATGVLIGNLYTTIMLYWIASKTINAKFREFVRSLVPGLWLNSVLIVSLFVTHYLLPEGLVHTNPGGYLITSVLVGGGAYSLAFLFLPIKSIAVESMRWRERLGLVQN